MPTQVQPIPPGYRTATILLIVREAPRAIDFYVQGLGARETARHTDPNGHIVNAELRFGGTPVQLAEEAPEWHNRSPLSLGGTPVSISLDVPDVDALVERAVAAGAQLERPLKDEFHGRRAGVLIDPFGHRWHVSSQIEEVSDEEMQRRFQELSRSEGA